MKAAPHCIPCIIHQVLLTARKAKLNKPRTQHLLTDLVNWLPALNFDRSPAEIASDCLARSYNLLAVKDPFATDKKIQHAYALKMLSGLRSQLAHTHDPLEFALRCAINGNLIDSLLLQEKTPDFSLKRLCQNPWGINHYKTFKRLLNKTQSVLYLLDNMGEAVFDKLVIESLRARGKEVTCVVRQKPVLNDVVLEDAQKIGLDKSGPIINPGVWAIGLPLHLASIDFKRRFRQADLVISKGQANFETLEGVEKDGLFFLFVVKCHTVARHLGVKLGRSILMQNISTV